MPMAAARPLAVLVLAPGAARGRWRRRRSCRRRAPSRSAVDVGVGAQRRVDLEDRVVGRGELVGQEQVVRRDLGGDVEPRAFAQRMISTEPAVETWQTCSREPTCSASRTSRAMIASSATAGQPRRPRTPRQRALVHLRVLGEARLLRVLGDHAVERLHVLQGAPHHHRVVHALAVVGEDPHPRGGVGHGAELGELLPPEPDRDGADGLDVAVAGLAPEPPDLLDDAGGVGDGVGVGHRVDGGEAAERGRAGAGLDGLGVLAAGLAQVRVQVDEAGQRDQAVGVDRSWRAAAARRPGADLGDRRRRASSRSAGSPPSDRRRAAGSRSCAPRAASWSGLPTVAGLARRRAAGRGRPSGRSRRWRPARR